MHEGAFIEGDIADASLLNDIFLRQPIHAVMHFAAYIDVGESVVNPAKYYLNNVVNALNLLNAMIKYDVKKLIFSSTAAVYGHPKEGLIDENHPCKPINPYGESKLMIEKILRDYDHAYGLRYCSLRYFNAAGGDSVGRIKNYQRSTSNLIPRILLSLKKGGNEAVIYGTDYHTLDGTCIRDYIHVEDLGSAHIAALEQLFSGSSSNVYNLGSGNGYSVRQVISSVERVLKREIDVIEASPRTGDPAVLLADVNKAVTYLGWLPRYHLDEMIAHAWEAYSEL